MVLVLLTMLKTFCHVGMEYKIYDLNYNLSTMKENSKKKIRLNHKLEKLGKQINKAQSMLGISINTLQKYVFYKTMLCC